LTSRSGRKETPSNWDETPRTIRGDNAPDGYETEAWKDEQLRLDRDWYNQEESTTRDDAHHEFQDMDGYYRKKELELQRKQVVIIFI
jgi:hypothetical protein